MNKSFLVDGSADKPYTLRVRIGENARPVSFGIKCSCPAGKNNTLCKHITFLICGEPSDIEILDLDDADLAEIRGSFAESELKSIWGDISANSMYLNGERANFKKRVRPLEESIRYSKEFFMTKAGEGLASDSVASEGAIRPPLSWIEFREEDSRAGRYASGWFFLVHEAFKPALDISNMTRIDKFKTADLRGKKSIELTGVGFDECKKNKKSFTNSVFWEEAYDEIISYKVLYRLETQGNPLLFSFRKSDTIESRCGNWSVQIDQSTFDTIKSPGNVGFMVYTKHQPMNAHEGVWRKFKWLSTSQQEFVALLMSGACQSIDLKNTQ